MNLDAFIALLKLQRLIRARKWHDAYLAAEVLAQIARREWPEARA